MAGAVYGVRSGGCRVARGPSGPRETKDRRPDARGRITECARLTSGTSPALTSAPTAKTRCRGRAPHLRAAGPQRWGLGRRASTGPVPPARRRAEKQQGQPPQPPTMHVDLWRAKWKTWPTRDQVDEFQYSLSGWPPVKLTC